MGPGATDKWLASGADVRRLPAETRGYIAGLAGGGEVKHYVRGDLIMDDYGNPRGTDPRMQATFDEYNRTAAEIEEEARKQKGKPTSKEAERYLKDKAAREARMKAPVPKAPVANVAKAGIPFLRGIPGIGAAITAGSLIKPGLDALMATDTGTASEDLDPIAAMQGTQGGYDRTVVPTPAPKAAAPAAPAPAPQTNVAKPPAEAPYQDVDPNAVVTAAPMSVTDKLFAQMQDALSKREARLEAARKQDPWLAGLAAGRQCPAG